MGKYPENWGANEIRYHESAELLCLYCFKYVHEQNTKLDADNNTICTSCAEDHDCYYCGTMHHHIETINGHRVCGDCKGTAVEDMDLTYGIDQRGDHAYFIHLKHFVESWHVDHNADTRTNDPVFFRCLNDEGFDHRHGWIERTKVVQWG